MPMIIPIMPPVNVSSEYFPSLNASRILNSPFSRFTMDACEILQLYVRASFLSTLKARKASLSISNLDIITFCISFTILCGMR